MEHKLFFEVPHQVEASFTLQRDAYEASYVDLIKGALLLQLPFALENMYLGALSASFGQRVMFSTSSRGASPYVGSVINYHKGSKLDIDRGTAENYLLGVGFDLALGRIFIGAFGGAFNYDAEVLSSDFQRQVEHVRSLRVGEPHDGTNALRQKNQQWEFLAGINVDYRFDARSYLGLSLLYSEFLYPIKPEVNDTLDLYDFYGQRYGGMSFHYSINHKKVTYFGELMGYLTPQLDSPQDYAFEEMLPYTFHPGGIVGVVYQPQKRTRSQFSIRYYSPFLMDFHTRGFAAGTSRGEVGVYSALSGRPLKWLRGKVFVDVAQSLYPDLSSSAEATFGGRLGWKIIRQLNASVTETLEFEIEELDNGNGSPALSSSLKMELSYKHPYFFVRGQGLFKHEEVVSFAQESGGAGILEMDVLSGNGFI